MSQAKPKRSKKRCKLEQEVLDSGRFRVTGDDWFDMVMGAVLGLTILGGCISISAERCGFPPVIAWLLFGCLVVVTVYRYWREFELLRLRTNLTEEENEQLLHDVLERLGWRVRKGAPQSVLDLISAYVRLFVNARYSCSDGYIGYNFRYWSSRVGRPAFFIGIRTYMRMRFEAGLRNEPLRRIQAGISLREQYQQGSGEFPSPSSPTQRSGC